MLYEKRPCPGTFHFFPKLRSASSLNAVPRRTMLLAAMWMAVAYAAWIFLSGAKGDQGYWELRPVIIGFMPLFLWALYDYRFGLLLAVMAAPLLNAPIIPHGFTQGFGDIFAACSIIGYALRHPNPSQWRILWRREYVWLGLILVAAAVSLVFTPVWGLQVPYGIKYGLAEIAGYSLAIAFLAILVHEMRSQGDLDATLYAVAAAILVVVLFSLVGLGLSSTCSVRYDTQTPLTTNGAITSTFMNPNYHAGYLVCVLPLALWIYLRSVRGTWRSYLGFVSVIFLIFFVQASISRAGLISLVILWIGWLAITRWRPGTRTMSVFFGLMLPFTVVLWGYPIYACHPGTVTEMAVQDRLKFAGDHSKNMGTSSGVRLQLAFNALRLWRENPVTGVGAALMSNFSSVEGNRNRAHNVLLTTLAEQGIVGAAVWMGWLGCLAMTIWRARRRINERGSQLAFLALALTAVVATSMFMDSLRVISLWQLGAIIIAWSVIPHKESPISDDIK